MDEFERMHRELSRLAEEMRRVCLGAPLPAALWRPAVNVYRLAEEFVICMDLAGMDRKNISVRVESRRLRVSGTRPPPEPSREADAPAQTLAMEIDYGPFERALELPAEVDAERVTANYRDGLLWVRMPLKRQIKTITPITEGES
jgi:HSP20 family protein